MTQSGITITDYEQRRLEHASRISSLVAPMKYLHIGGHRYAPASGRTGRKGFPVTINGVTYKSRLRAAKALGVSDRHLRRLMEAARGILR